MKLFSEKYYRRYTLAKIYVMIRNIGIFMTKNSQVLQNVRFLQTW